VYCGFKSPKLRCFACAKGKIREIKYEIQRPALNTNRIRALFPIDVLAAAAVLIIGAGSGGGLLSLMLSSTALGTLWVADSEKLEPLNVVRHIGSSEQVGEYKAKIAVDAARAKNPRIKAAALIKLFNEKNVGFYEPYVSKSTLVINSTGSAKINNILAPICRKHGKPLLVGGCFERAMGGYALLCLPDDNAPCPNCLFHQAGAAHEDSNARLAHLKAQYGFTDDDLHAQQGIFTDISFVTLLATKMALIAILRGSDHSLEMPNHNFVMWSAKTMTATWATVKQREDCSVCNPEGFYAKRLRELPPQPIQSREGA
jgi:molybdopterin/thiamine biosynthesis adenylyltransferase